MRQHVALVTGGARRIGAAISLTLAEAGHAVVIHCRTSRGEAEALAARIVASGGRAKVVTGDLADQAGLPALYAETCLAFGPPDLLVNNASIFASDSFGALEAARLRASLAVNAEAPILLAQELARALPANRRGAVVNIIDQRVLRPNPQHFSYALSKALLFQATKTMAQALAPRIRVNAVGPGPTLANELDGMAGFAREAAGTLLGEAINPREIAEAVLYLASAEKVTGQMIAVDSGQHLGWRTPDVVE